MATSRQPLVWIGSIVIQIVIFRKQALFTALSRLQRTSRIKRLMAIFGKAKRSTQSEKPTMPSTILNPAGCPPFDRNPRFLNRLSETQYKCSHGDPFEKVGGGGTVGVGCAGY